MRRAAVVLVVLALVVLAALVYQDAAQDQHRWRCANVPEVETHCPELPGASVRMVPNVIRAPE